MFSQGARNAGKRERSVSPGRRHLPNVHKHRLRPLPLPLGGFPLFNSLVDRSAHHRVFLARPGDGIRYVIRGDVLGGERLAGLIAALRGGNGDGADDGDSPREGKESRNEALRLEGKGSVSRAINGQDKRQGRAAHHLGVRLECLVLT